MIALHWRQAHNVADYNGIHGAFHWQVVGRTLRVFSAKRRIGLLQVFEHVNAANSEQAQWSAQAKIDLNLEALRRIEAGKAAAADGQPQPAGP